MYYYNENKIHVFEVNNRYFLYNIMNMNCCEISKVIYRILKLPNPINAQKIKIALKREFPINEINESINVLTKWKILNETSFEVSIDFNEYQNLFEENNIWLSGLNLVISQECNLRCKYCSADYGHFGNKNNSYLMTKETAKKAVDFLLDKLPQTIKDPMILFVGGEPLLNFKIIKFVVEYIKTETSLKPNYSLNTNGTLMNEEIAEWLINNNIHVRFSIDGNRKIHNQNRVFKNGTGSYERTIKGLNKYRKYSGRISVQASIPHGRKLKKGVRELWKMGAEEVLANFTGESAFLNAKSFMMTEEDYKYYLKEWKELSNEMIDNIVKFGHTPTVYTIISLLEKIHNRKPRSKGCGAGRAISVLPNEEISLCQGFVGLDGYVIGNLDMGIDKVKLKNFGELFVKHLRKCENCWAKHACNTGCIAQSAMYNELGNEFEPSRTCYIAKKMVEYAIYLYNKLKESKSTDLNKLFPQRIL